MGRWLFLLLLAAGPGSAPAGAGAPVLYAAASLGTALEELSARDRLAAILSLGSTSTLARQIERGAPADLFLAASSEWMDYLDSLGLVEPGSRVDLLGNRLVVVAPRGRGFRVEPRHGFPFAAAFAGRLAMGDPSHVPVGQYGRQALEWLGWWPAIEDRVVPAVDARAAVAYVEQGLCAAGIVYATDARGSAGLEVLAELPDSSHAPIVYPLALVRGHRTPEAERLLQRLRSPAAAQVFREQGFRVLADTATAGLPSAGGR